jgi:ankyrin repeat protein
MFAKKDLKKAIKANNYAEVEEIVSKDPNLVNQPNKHGFTILHDLSHMKNDIAVLLIETATDVNHASELGITPLHLAVRYGNNKIVKLLIEKGAEVNAKDYEGLTPLGYAVKVKDHASYLESIKLLLNANAAINIQDHSGKTPLFLATESDNALAMELLLNKDAEIDSTDNNGRNALFYAAKSKLLFPILLLVKYGIKLNAKDNSGLNFLEYTQKFTSLKDMELVQNFIKNIKLEVQSYDKFEKGTETSLPSEEIMVMGEKALSEDAEV